MKMQMTIKQALKKYNKIEIELLLMYVLKKSKEFLYMNGDNRLTRIQENRLTRMVRRRLRGEPIAYILGHKDFWGLRFKVNKNVLIPRPETEELADLVLARLHSLFSWQGEDVASAAERQMRSNQIVCLDSPHLRLFSSRRRGRYGMLINILDVGTGSGCIIIAIAKQLQNFQFSIFNFQFTASDISEKALKIAKENSKAHHVKINFIKSNLFNNIQGKFNVIVANLPYVPNKNYELGIKNLEWEPKNALTDGTDEFVIYHNFFKQLPRHIQPTSLIFLEIDPKAKPYILKWTKKYLPRAEVKFNRDLNNFWRIAEIQL